MFSMCSELTPRARILDTRIPQLMQPCTHRCLMIDSTMAKKFHFFYMSIYRNAKSRSEYESFSDLGEIRVWLRADFQSGSRVLKKVF